MEKMVKKLFTLKQNQYRSRKNECSFFKSIFPFEVSLCFRLVTFDSSLVLILFSVHLKVYLFRLFHVLREVREVRQRGQ